MRTKSGTTEKNTEGVVVKERRLRATTIERDLKIKELYDRGFKPKEIALALGASLTIVYGSLDRQGLKRTKEKVEVVKVQEGNGTASASVNKDTISKNPAYIRDLGVMAMMLHGVKKDQIYLEIGCDYSLVEKLLKEVKKKEVVEEVKSYSYEDLIKNAKEIQHQFDVEAIDVPKVKALLKAGWSLERVARSEFGCSTGIIKDAVDLYEQRVHISSDLLCSNL